MLNNEVGFKRGYFSKWLRRSLTAAKYSIHKKLILIFGQVYEIPYFHVMKWCYFCFVLLLFGACTLSSSQEATLHQALTSYLNAHNEGALKTYVGYTHPNVVGYYEDQGDSIFRKKFELFSPENGGDYLQDGTIKEIEINGNQIHVHYLFDSLKENNFDSTVGDLNLIAISVDDGKTWFFVEESDYKNDKIFSKDERLIDL